MSGNVHDFSVLNKECMSGNVHYLNVLDMVCMCLVMSINSVCWTRNVCLVTCIFQCVGHGLYVFGNVYSFSVLDKECMSGNVHSFSVLDMDCMCLVT